MAMFIQNSADHVSEWKGIHRPAVAGRPVRHRQAGAGAGDEAAGNDQKNCGSGNEFRVAGQPHGRLSVHGAGFMVLSSRCGSGFRTKNPEPRTLNLPALVPRRPAGFEGEVVFLLVFRGECDVRGLLAELFVPCGELVRARRHALDGEGATVAGCGEEWMAHETSLSVYPPIDVVITRLLLLC